MITLKGHQAIVMHVAKYGLKEFGSVLDQLRYGMAVCSGLKDPASIKLSDVLQLVAATYDRLVAAGLVPNPASQLVESFRLASYAPRDAVLEPELTLLTGLMSSMTCMQVNSNTGKTVEWECELPAKLAEYVRVLHQESEGDRS